MTRRPLVLSLHGIRTRGTWQKSLTRALNEAGFDHEPLDYGFFSTLRFVNPAARRRRVDWFRDEYGRVTGNRSARPSIIAHSFGTYIVAEAMRIYPEVVFDSVILCGSVVRPDYPWPEVLRKGAARRVLNDHGYQDFWAGIAAWGVADAGASGKSGFEQTAGGLVLQRAHPDWRHSDYFYDLNYRRNWIPFLRGEELGAEGTAAPGRRNLRPVLAAVVLTALMAAGAIMAWRSRPESKAAAPQKPVDARAQKAVLSGTVTESGGNPIGGATIFVGGKPYLSDDDGNFRIELEHPGDVELRVTKGGYEDAYSLVTAPTSVPIQLRRK